MSGYSTASCAYDRYHTESQCGGASCQYRKMCDNKCGSVLDQNAIICILVTPKGEEQVWCEDCKQWNWDDLKAAGWRCDDEESEDDDCVAAGCDEDECVEFCDCECTTCQRNRPTGESDED